MDSNGNKSVKPNKLCSKSIKLTKAQKGTVGEYQAIVDLTKQGYHVALACNPQCPFDLVAVGEDGEIRLIDVKSNTYRRKSKKTYKKSLKIYRCPTARQKKLKIELMMVDNENQ